MGKMTADGKVYRALRTPADPRWSSIRGSEQLLDELRYLGFKQGLPLLLSTYLTWGESNPQGFHDLLKAYVNLAVRSYTILGYNPNEYETEFSGWAIAIKRRDQTIDQVTEELRERTPSDEDVRAGITGMNGVKPKVGPYIITKINDAWQNPLNRSRKN